MKIDILEKKLKNMGYTRENYSEIHNNTIITGDFSKKSINHTIARWCKIDNANFDYAAATGSIYERCKFNNCSMYQADYEFCSFFDCEFTAKKQIISSFNNCDFIGTSFEKINFKSCTFTGAYFENCHFNKVSIVNSTLENAVFQDCFFSNMNLRNLNMDYVNIENPTMKNVILPFSQIPYMFGCLQYMMSTSDLVRVSAPNGGSISIDEYLKDVIPNLLQYWNLKCKAQVEFYFPLANVYIALKDYEKASECLRKGIIAAVAEFDFRMIKFYSKLIARTDNFNLNVVHKFYNIINKLGSLRDYKTPQMRSFMRNIGEIKTTLLSNYKKPTLNVEFLTNISSKKLEKIDVIIGRLFPIAKMGRSIFPNLVEIKLSENSPLLISLHIIGQEENIIFLLPILLRLTDMPKDEVDLLMPPKKYSTELISKMENILSNADQLITDCQHIGVTLSLSEYSILNCESCFTHGIKPFYFKHQDDVSYPQIPLLIDKVLYD